ncbi:MAG TPA: hypothetical protein PK614_06240 [Nitrospira sp.]|nr:hypothetical protein [Nitrospira sp.]
MHGEEWIREQIRQNRPISFPVDWPENHRSISGEFFLELLLDPCWKASGGGFVIKNAVVNSEVYKRYLTCETECYLENCEFVNGFGLPYANLKRVLRFKSCKFGGQFNLHSSHLADVEFLPSEDGHTTQFLQPANFMRCVVSGLILCDKCLFRCKTVNFNSVKVRGNVNLSYSVFEGNVDFTGAKIAGQFNATDTRFTNQESEVAFVGSELSGGAILDSARFSGGANFRAAKFGLRLQCEGVAFLNKDKEIAFDSCKVAGTAMFENARFFSSLDLSSSHIEGDLACKGAHFSNEKTSATFNSMTVLQNAFLVEAVFSGPSSFISVHIERNLICALARFETESANLNMQSMKVGGNAIFDRALFMGNVDLGGIGIAGQLVVKDSKFPGAPNGLSLNGAKVLRGLFLNGTHFNCPLDLTGGEIGAQLGCRDVCFAKEDGTISFSNVKVHGDLSIDNATFAGPFSLVGAVIEKQLRCTEANFQTTAAVALSGIVVGTSAVFSNSSFQNEVVFRYARVGQNLSFAGCQFHTSLDLRNSLVAGYLYVFSIPENSVPLAQTQKTKLPTIAQFSGLRYSGTDIGQSELWREWLKPTCAGLNYEADSYLAVEKCFRLMGLSEEADRVYYEMKNVETWLSLRRWRIDRWGKGMLLRWLVGYGVYGYRLWCWVLLPPLIIFFWCRVSQPVFNQLFVMLYAVDIFLPIDLHQDAYCRLPTWATAVIELLGWVLVPIVIAQLTGYLKRNAET